jgi:aldehyde dehydrogenase (NAD+)
VSNSLDRDAHYIDGRWVAATGTLIAVENPATEETLAQVPSGTTADVNLAVSAARRAFPGWRETPATDRAATLDRLHELMSARADEFVSTIALDVGAPLKIARAVHVGLSLSDVRLAQRALGELTWSERVGNSDVLLEPVGVVGAITP